MAGEIQPERKVAFTYNGFDVFFGDDDQMVNLNDMWRSVGSPAGNEPWRWGQTPKARKFIASVAKNPIHGKNVIWKTRKGKHLGGTQAHWQVAMAYAKYLDDDLHIFVNAAAREFVREAADPDLKLKRSIEGLRRRGVDDGRIMERVEGILVRKEFTSELQAHGVKVNSPRDNGYSRCTDALNTKVIGLPAKLIREERGLAKSAPTRDAFSVVELAAIRFAEALATQRLNDVRAYGNDQCEAVCIEVGDAVKSSMSVLKAS